MIQILNKRSSTHLNWCEDNYLVEEFDNYLVGAVFDGCSTGIQSHFASTLMVYTFEKSIRKNHFNSNYEHYFRSVITDVRFDLETIKHQLNLIDLNLLSTIVFFVFDKNDQSLNVTFIGDGSIFVNQERFTHDENNIPDYLGYHLEESWYEFIQWIKTKPTKIFSNVNSFAICTDGIDSFKNVKNLTLPKNIPVDFMFNSEFANLKNGLNKKFNILINRVEELKRSDELSFWEIQDDITIIYYNANI